MLRPEDAVAGDIHHAVAHRRADEDADGGHDEYRLEGGRFGADGRVEEIDRVIAHSDRQIEDRQQEEEHNDTQEKNVHRVVCMITVQNNLKDISKILQNRKDFVK